MKQIPLILLRRASVLAALFVTTTLAQAALSPEKLARLPAAASRPVDFAKDIRPIFETSCVQCHGKGKHKGGFSMETYAEFLEGGDAGAPAIAGKSAESLVVEMISGLSPDIVMPQKGKKLTAEQISLVRAWIDQGMKWPETITFHRTEPPNLRAVALTDAPAPRTSTTATIAFDNPLDRHVDAYFAKNQIAWPQPVDDRTYARRVWLDTVGLLPSPAELDAFLADRAPDKRTKLVARLLADDQRYAEHWLSFWNDLLRNDYKGTGYIDGGRKQITAWLYTALARNLPYDRFVSELINPGAEAEGFTRGILWRGAVNASMVPPMQAAQSVAQVFLGVNLKCASCHDSFINEYTLADSYGLASIYADHPLEIAECDKPTGEMARVKFLYAELGEIDTTLGPIARKQKLAEIITGKSNGRLPRTIVNRLWQRFMGYGLVEPIDEMDKPAWSPEVLDWLAADLAGNGFNLKHTMARILTSRAYQLPSTNVRETEEHYVFRGPAMKRLSAEQFADALLALGRTPYEKADARLNRRAALATQKTTLPLQPKWIWSTPDAHMSAIPGTLVFRRTLKLDAAPTEAVLAIAADDNYTLKINGKNVASSGRRNSTSADWVDLKQHLRVGDNVFEITAANMAPDEGRLVAVDKDQLPPANSPAGLILYARIRNADTVLDFVSDAANWTATTEAKTSATLHELGDVDLAPWRLGRNFLDVASVDKDTLPVTRAALVAADPLMVALGRPNREQVVTVRQGAATTLQALELTNGSTLAKQLKHAAGKILAAAPADSSALVTALYRETISRPPTAKELAIAQRIVGTPAKAEGIEDLLWALTMLPEFQLY